MFPISIATWRSEIPADASTERYIDACLSPYAALTVEPLNVLVHQ